MHDIVSRFSKNCLVPNGSFWRNSLRHFSKYANIFTVTPNVQETEGRTWLCVKAFPNWCVDNELANVTPFETLSISWPFTVDDSGPLQWMQTTVKSNARFMDVSEKSVPNVILMLGWGSYPRSVIALTERYLFRSQKGDLTSFSVHSTQTRKLTESDTTLSQLKGQILDSLNRPKSFKVYLLRASRRLKKINIEGKNLTYQAALCELDADACEFDLIPISKTPTDDEKISVSARKVLQYVYDKANELQAEERVLLITSLHPEVSKAVFQLSQEADHPKISFTSLRLMKDIFTHTGTSLELFQKITEGMTSPACIDKFYNTATHFELRMINSTENRNTIRRPQGSTPPCNRIFCYFSKDSLTLFHITYGGSEAKASVHIVNHPEKDFTDFISQAAPSLLIFWDAAGTMKKLTKTLSLQTIRRATQGVQLWCLSYAEILIHAPRGEDFRVSTVKERLESCGMKIKNARIAEGEGTLSSVPYETLTGIRMNEHFLVQWEESKVIPNFHQKTQHWVDELFSNRRCTRQHFQQNVGKLYNSLLRGYVPSVVPLDFQHSWNWFSPSHLVPFFFGGSVKLGTDSHREQTGVSRMKSHLIVELAHNSGALPRISETYLRHYARRRQIGLHKTVDLQHTVRSKIDCLGPLQEYQILVYDLETTGLDVHHDRIVEFAIWDPVSNRAYESLVNPEVSIPPAVTSIHGISDENVVSAPTFAGVARAIVSFLKTIRRNEQTELLLIAHNSKKLDQPVLRRQFHEVNIAFPVFAHYVDSLPTFFHCKRKIPEAQLGSLRLAHLIDQFGVEVEGTLHRALTDAKSLWKVIEQLAVRYYYGKSTSSDSSATSSTNPIPEVNSKSAVSNEKVVMGHQAVLSLIGHTIEENIAESRTDDEDASAVESAGISVSVEVNGLIDKRALLEGDSTFAQNALTAIETLRYADRVRAPDNVSMSALQSFLVSLEKFPYSGGDAQRVMYLLGRSLHSTSTKHSSG